MSATFAAGQLPALRTHTSAAPLKPVRPSCGSHAGPPALRTHTSAAPLKRSGARARCCWRTSLRTHTSAAPLKRGRNGRGGICLPSSPHSHECGSVEAGSPGSCSIPTTSSPHSHECGSVEANHSPLVLNPHTPLRTHTSAAPLKLDAVQILVSNSTDSPHSHECGSVEAWLLLLPYEQEHLLSALTRVRLR